MILFNIVGHLLGYILEVAISNLIYFLQYKHKYNIIEIYMYLLRIDWIFYIRYALYD